MNDIKLSPHFMLSEFLNLKKYPTNIPSMEVIENLTYGCRHLLEPAREVVGPILINSGYRNEAVNRQVGGVRNSQHLKGQAADIRPKDPKQFQRLVDFLRRHDLTDQLLTGNGWLHISWKPKGLITEFNATKSTVYWRQWVRSSTIAVERAKGSSGEVRESYIALFQIACSG